jgi:hypothetical protein
MRRIIEMAIEWNTHIFILDGDIYKAYDNTRHGRVLQALQRRDVPPILVAAIIREVARPKGRIRLGNLESQNCIRRSRALWQGDPLAPKLFNITLDELAEKFEKRAQSMRWGWPIKGPRGNTYICLLLFADNYWIIATSPAELQNANDYWQNLLREAGWHTPASELCYCSTAFDDQFTTQKVYSEGIEVERRLRAEGFKALGTQVTFTCRDDKELERRFKAAWCSFNKHKDILCCKIAPIAGRLDFLHRVVVPALFWCSGSWNLRAQQFTQLRGLQRKMVRKMLGFRKRDEEDLDHFMHRTEATISNLLQLHWIVSWDVYARRTVFKWAGWMARLANLDPSRLTLKILQHKNLEWLQKIKDENKGRELHGRYIKVWRWETMLYNFTRENYPGDQWFSLAQDKERWKVIVDNIM